jgi:hypothetical protein
VSFIGNFDNFTPHENPGLFTSRDQTVDGITAEPKRSQQIGRQRAEVTYEHLITTETNQN